MSRINQQDDKSTPYGSMNEQEDKKQPAPSSKKPYKGLLHEMNIITAIVADKFLNQVFAQIDGGYMDAVDIISEASINFYNTYRKNIENPKTKWEEVLAPHSVPGYDDLVLIHCSRYIINKYYSVTLKLQ